MSEKCTGEYLDLRKRKEQEDGRSYITVGFIICIIHQTTVNPQCDRLLGGEGLW
jgi:hypothetical protein